MVDLGHLSHLSTDDSSERYPGCRASRRTLVSPGSLWPMGRCVCVCDGHTFGKGPQGKIRPQPSLQEVNGLVMVVPGLLMGSLLLVMGCRVFW